MAAVLVASLRGEEVSYPSCALENEKLSRLHDFTGEDYHLGSALARLGDIDGDGVMDMAVGIPGDSHNLAGHQNAGSVLVVRRHADGSVKHAHKWPVVGRDDFEVSKQDQLGRSLATLSDLDGDAVPELVVGVPGLDVPGRSDSGGFVVLFLARNGTVKRKTTTSGARERQLASSDEFGSAVANLGDLNGDGIDDLAVGAHRYDGGDRIDTGCVYVCYMLSGGAPSSCDRIEGHTHGSFPTLHGNDYFGASIAAIGDVDGNGVQDLAVGAWKHGDSGAVFLIFLTQGGLARNYTTLSSDSTVDFFHKGNTLGWSLASLGRRLAVGDDLGLGGYGSVAVFTLSATGPLVVEATISAGVGGGPDDLHKQGRFGSSVLFLDDEDDQSTDFRLAVGARWDREVANAAGSVYDITFGPFNHSRCSPQALIPPPSFSPTFEPTRSPAPTLSQPPAVPRGDGKKQRADHTTTIVIACLVVLIVALSLSLLALFLAYKRAKRRAAHDSRAAILHNQEETWSTSVMITDDDLFRDTSFVAYNKPEPPETAGLVGIQLPDCDGDTDDDVTPADGRTMRLV